MSTNSPHRHVHNCSWSFLGIPLDTYTLAMSEGHAGLMPYASWDLDFSLMVSAQRIDCNCSNLMQQKFQFASLSYHIIWTAGLSECKELGMVTNKEPGTVKEENLKFLVNAQSQKCFTLQLTSANSVFPAEIIFLLWEGNKWHFIINHWVNILLFFALLNHMMISWNTEPKELKLAGYHCRRSVCL